MQLDKIVQRIDDAFGEAMPFTANPLESADREVLYRVFGDEGYHVYLQDQINRQIIRDYLTNAAMLGFVSEEDLGELTAMAANPDGRAALSLHMLMTSVEEAASLLHQGIPESLTLLEVDPDAPPHIHLVQS
ncbi:hypothetical protein E4634_07660 [Mangrovimicrobium sediminis]|uniref:Uncharacterized protein n=1 Tax=Mangrovimicrobium sediminis TaxID=2562682 RepID=A0A4Z0M3R1_9GAMM|nr:hypothetical protein [Haliea sp. SAOS-164]TGD74008.1 hypothetical protein E4634_07660 [Haliea sp. SAOS-164]